MLALSLATLVNNLTIQQFNNGLCYNRSVFKIQKMDFLISFYIFCIVVSELMGGKTFFITKIGNFPLSASVAIFTLPIIFTINDMITEVFGVERARSVVRAGLLSVFGIIVFSLLAIHLPPSLRFSKTEAAYDTIFSTSARIALASLTAFAIAEFTDIFVFQKIRKQMGKKALWLRNNVSNFVSQFADTTIFMFLAFYNPSRSVNDNIIFLLGLILPYWLLKCFMSVIETPFVYLGVNWLKSEK